MTREHSPTGADGTDSPLQLLGRAIESACDDPMEPTVGLQALVVYAAEYARLHHAEYPDFLAALESCIRLHTQSCDERMRTRVGIAVRHWAALAYDRQ